MRTYLHHKVADWTERYPRIVEEAARLNRDTVLDCEVICSDEHGRADFDRACSPLSTDRVGLHQTRRCRCDDGAVLAADGANAPKRPRALYQHLVSAASQRCDRLLAKAILNQKPVRLDRARIERLRKMPAGEQRQVDRGLQIESVVQVA